MKLKHKALTSLLLFGICSANVFAASDIAEHNYEPSEYTIDGQQYLDGIPYVSDADLEEINEAELNNEVEDLTSPYARYATNKWFSYDTDTYYTSVDRDRQSFYANPPELVQFQTTSKTLCSITGSMKFGFEDVAEAEMSCKLQTSYGKKVTYNVRPKPYRTYEQKTACEMLQTNYKYVSDHWYDDNTYYASTHDYQGIERWFWDNPID